MLNILAGGDTTAATLRAAVYHLCKNPHAYSKLTSELGAAELAIPAQWKDIQPLPYLDAVIRETIRTNPGIAMNFEREVPEGGFTLPDGRYLPAGTKAGINPAVTGRDSDIFGQDADAFNPDRWLKSAQEDQSEYEERVRRMREVADFSFGAGHRICMGRNLALVEMYKFLATIYSLFDVSTTPECPDSSKILDTGCRSRSAPKLSLLTASSTDPVGRSTAHLETAQRLVCLSLGYTSTG